MAACGGAGMTKDAVMGALSTVGVWVMTACDPSPLREGSAERSGGRGGGRHKEGFHCGYPHPTSLRLATLPARGRDKRGCGTAFMQSPPHAVAEIGASGLVSRCCRRKNDA